MTLKILFKISGKEDGDIISTKSLNIPFVVPSLDLIHRFTPGHPVMLLHCVIMMVIRLKLFLRTVVESRRLVLSTLYHGPLG